MSNGTINNTSNDAEDVGIFVGDYSSDISSIRGRMIPKPPPHPDTTRAQLTKRLLWTLIALLILPCVVVLLFDEKPIDKLLEFVKWSIGIVSPIFGTAMGFYFGGKLKSAEHENGDS